MFSDKITKYKLAESKDEFIAQFKGQRELTTKLHFGEVLFIYEKDSILAVINKCPHQGAKLNGCTISSDYLICPLHQFKFNLSTGRGHGMYLERFPLEETKEGFFLIRNYFSWFGE